VQLEGVSALGSGGHGGFFGRGEGDAAVGGHDGFGLYAEFQEADAGFEATGVPEDGVCSDQMGIGFGNGNLEDDFGAVRGKFFRCHATHSDSPVKDSGAAVDGRAGGYQTDRQSAGWQIFGIR